MAATSNTLDVQAAGSDDGPTPVLRVVNLSERPQPANLRFADFTPRQPVASVEELAALAVQRQVVNIGGSFGLMGARDRLVSELKAGEAGRVPILVRPTI